LNHPLFRTQRMTASAMTPETFKALLSELTAQFVGNPLDDALDAWLSREHGCASQICVDLATDPHRRQA
jgi:hypothetical protein